MKFEILKYQKKEMIRCMAELKSNFSSFTANRSAIICMHWVALGYCSLNVISSSWIMYSM
jgi:hypothetical protein